jgi:hypothetical protein
LFHFNVENGIGDFKIKNDGQSPAKNVKYVAAMFYDKNPTEGYGADIILPAGLNTVSGNVIAPGEHIEVKPRQKGDEPLSFIVSEVTSGQAPFVRLVCHIYYRDVFNTDRLTKYSAVLIKVPAPPEVGAGKFALSWNITNTHNDFT